jgi:hypothetical protein
MFFPKIITTNQMPQCLGAEISAAGCYIWYDKRISGVPETFERIIYLKKFKDGKYSKLCLAHELGHWVIHMVGGRQDWIHNIYERLWGRYVLRIACACQNNR